MNYEEKILEALAELKAEVSDIRAAQTEMQVTQTQQGEQLAAVQAAQARQGEMLAELDERSLRSAVLLEADVTRSLGRLYEGHGAIMEKLDRLASQEQVDEQESDISMMKDAIKMMRLELNELKKAQ